MHRRPSLFAPVLAAWIVCTLSLSAHAQQLSVKDSLWGFDGKRLPGHFNLFSVSVTNIGGAAYDGPFTLSSDAPASQVQQIYLAPGQERLVQFIFHVGRSYDSYSLSWKGGSFRLPEISDLNSEGPPATVVLVDDARLSNRAAKIRPFPEGRFPTSVAGTSNLHAAILDHVPDWDAARRTAFMDWLRGGGIVVIGEEVGGAFPKFAGELADLNPKPGTSGFFHLGSGSVFHLDARAESLTLPILGEKGVSPATGFSSEASYTVQSEITSHLGAITNPAINWQLIFFVAFLYVVIIGPVHFIWGRKQRRAIVSIGAFLATVALFSWAFTVIGRRGVGESTQVYSLSIANHIGGGNYDVTQWSSIFVTSGDIYKISHPQAEASYYIRASAGPSLTRFSVFPGKNGFIEAEIPLFSRSNFVQRAKMPGPPIRPEVKVWESEKDRLTGLELDLPPEFPNVAEVWVRHRERFYSLNRNGSKLVLSAADSVAQKTFLSHENIWRIQQSNFDGYSYGGRARTRQPLSVRENRVFENVRHLLIGISTSASPELAVAFERPHESAAGRADLFIYTGSPPSFRTGEPFTDSEKGRTLYRFTIYPPDAS